jgi:formamidopyrimidine-DNA glycosylase
MPEGPEVAVICTSLDTDPRIRSQNDGISPLLVLIEYSTASKLSGDKYPHNFCALHDMLPAKVERVYPKGKKIIMKLVSMINDKSITLITSLGMEGKYVWIRGTHSELWLDFKQADGSIQTLWFDDSRKFGNFYICITQTEIDNALKDVGPSFLNLETREMIPFDIFYKVATSKRIVGKQIADFLMEQKYFSGIGNYLKSEILYASKIDPSRSLGSLSQDEFETIHINCHHIIWESYKARGLTLSSYWDPFGRRGGYVPMVYGKKTDPYGNAVVKVELKDGRTTHWVPTVQV